MELGVDTPFAVCLCKAFLYFFYYICKSTPFARFVLGWFSFFSAAQRSDMGYINRLHCEWRWGSFFDFVFFAGHIKQAHKMGLVGFTRGMKWHNARVNGMKMKYSDNSCCYIGFQRL